MLKLYFTNKFKKDYNLMKKRGLDMNLIDDIIRQLSRQEPLSEDKHDHYLLGKYKRL